MSNQPPPAPPAQLMAQPKGKPFTLNTASAIITILQNCQQAVVTAKQLQEIIESFANHVRSADIQPEITPEMAQAIMLRERAAAKAPGVPAKVELGAPTPNAEAHGSTQPANDVTTGSNQSPPSDLADGVS